MKYLSNHLSDFPQILNLTWWDQTKIKNCLKWRWPQNIALEWIESKAYCQNPNSTKTSVQQSLRLDYILTVISTPPTTPPPGTLTVVVVVNWPGSAGQRQTVQLYSHTQVSGTLHIWASNFFLLKIIGFWKFLPQNPKIFRLRTEGLFIGPSKIEFGAICFQQLFPIFLDGNSRMQCMHACRFFHVWVSSWWWVGWVDITVRM